MKAVLKRLIIVLSFIFIAFFYIGGLMAEDNKELISIELKNGKVLIETRPDIAPLHVERIMQLVKNKEYDGVVFHRVIEGFMAQTGDVQFGNSNNDSFNLSRAGTGGSSMPDIKAEFSKVNHGRGSVSMARTQEPDSANSQFFICFNDCSHLDGQYSLWGQVIEGMEFVDQIKKGSGPGGSVSNPDKIIKMEILKK
tara:strand:+ start:1261 stop:1848 length:588 start_codon:yes stop_codon:yes gene_type:complete